MARLSIGPKVESQILGTEQSVRECRLWCREHSAVKQCRMLTGNTKDWGRRQEVRRLGSQKDRVVHKGQGGEEKAMGGWKFRGVSG